MQNRQRTATRSRTRVQPASSTRVQPPSSTRVQPPSRTRMQPPSTARVPQPSRSKNENDAGHSKSERVGRRDISSNNSTRKVAQRLRKMSAATNTRNAQRIRSVAASCATKGKKSSRGKKRTRQPNTSPYTKMYDTLDTSKSKEEHTIIKKPDSDDIIEAGRKLRVRKVARKSNSLSDDYTSGSASIKTKTTSGTEDDSISIDSATSVSTNASSSNSNST